MAKKQSRRTFSVNRSLYNAITEHAAARNVSASQWVAEVAVEKLRAEGSDFQERLCFAPPRKEA